MNRAFTGPSRNLTEDMRSGVWAAVLGLDPDDAVGAGCAFGVDTEVFVAASGRFICHAFPPSHLTYFNRDPYYWADVKHEPTPGEPSGAPTYRMRNQRMIDWADELIAFTWSPEFYRSGEWMTINMARKAGIPVTVNSFPRERVLT